MSLSAVVGDTETRAPVDGEVVVVHTVIALLTIGSIDDTITAKWNSAVGSASIGSGVGVVHTSVTLFQAVQDTITANWELAVGSAGVGNVGVGSTEIAFFSSFEVSVTALEFARWVTSIKREVVLVVALFTSIDNTVTAFGKGAGNSASVGEGVAVLDSVITEFSGVDDTVTASWAKASGSAAVGGVSVVASVIAFLGGVDWFESATTHLGTVGRAPPISNVEVDVCGVLGVDRVALFSGKNVDDTVTTS